jgi:hypothetical protein
LLPVRCGRQGVIGFVVHPIPNVALVGEVGGLVGCPLWPTLLWPGGGAPGLAEIRRDKSWHTTRAPNVPADPRRAPSPRYAERA